MTEQLTRPKFWPSFFSALAERAQSGTLWRVYFGVAVCALVGAGAAYLMPARLWLDEHWETSTTVYTAILTINGLILALSWSAFSKIFETISAPKFCSFLRRNNLLNKYIVTVSFVHALQIFAVVASAIGLALIVVDVGYIWVDRVVFGVMVFASVYAIAQATDAVGLMKDLIWQKSIFDEHMENSKSAKILPMSGKNDR
jgi:hypothetical protein